MDKSNNWILLFLQHFHRKNRLFESCLMELYHYRNLCGKCTNTAYLCHDTMVSQLFNISNRNYFEASELSAVDRKNFVIKHICVAIHTRNTSSFSLEIYALYDCVKSSKTNTCKS